MLNSLSSVSELPLLETVKAHFDEWRRTRSCRSKIPEALLDEARSLIGRYPKRDISDQLKINYARLSPENPESFSDAASFVEVPLNLQSLGLSCGDAELQHPGGTILRLKSLPEHQLLSVLKLFLTGTV